MSSGAESVSAAASAGAAGLSPRGAAWLLALLGWTLLVCFYDLGDGGGLEPVGAWVAQTAREMSQAEGWRAVLVPRFCGEARVQKSPGAYWAVCLAAYLRGGAVDEVAVRIPNAVAGTVLVLTVFWLTLRIAGERAAIFAGFATASSAMILHWSHVGSSDLGLASLCALSLSCLWIGAEVHPPGPRRAALWLAGYLAGGLAMLYKMPVPLAAVGIPALLYLLLARRWRMLASGWHLPGLLLFCLPWLPWVLSVGALEPNAWYKWRIEYLDRLTGRLPTVEQQKQWFFYLLYVGVAFLLSVPYSLSLPQALGRAFRRQQGARRAGMLFAASWFLSLLAFFTAATGKETRYFLPAMPPLFVLLGVELARFFDPRRPLRPGRARAAFWLVCLLVPAGLAGLGLLMWRRWYLAHRIFESFRWPDQVLLPYLVAAAIFAAGAVCCAWLYCRRKTNAAFGALVATMWLAWLWVWPKLMPVLMSQAPYKDFAAQLRLLDPQYQARLRQIAQQDPRVVWYSDVRFPRIIDQLKLLELTGGVRDLRREIRIVGREMVRQLEGPELALFVILSGDYVQFQAAARFELARQGRALPASYIWLLARQGRLDRRYILFGNRPPPWPEPQEPAALRRAIARRLRRLRAGAGAAASGPARRAAVPSAGVPAGGG